MKRAVSLLSLAAALAVSVPALAADPPQTSSVRCEGRGVSHLGRCYCVESADSGASVSQIASVDAVFVEPFEGPEPYQRKVTMAPVGDVSARAETTLRFQSLPSGFGTRLDLAIARGDELVTGSIDVTFEPGKKGRIAASGGTLLGDVEVAVAITQRAPFGGPKAGLRYLLSVEASGPGVETLQEIALSFGEFVGADGQSDAPSPSVTAVNLPFVAFERTFSVDGLLFDGSPAGYTYALTVTPVDSGGDPLAPSQAFEVQVESAFELPMVSSVPARTAPVLAVCDLSWDDGQACSAEGISQLADQLTLVSGDLLDRIRWKAQTMARLAHDGIWNFHVFTEEWTTRQQLGQATQLGAEAKLIEAGLLDGLLGLSSGELIELVGVLEETLDGIDGTTAGQPWKRTITVKEVIGSQVAIGDTEYDTDFIAGETDADRRVFVGGLTPVFLGDLGNDAPGFLIDLAGYMHTNPRQCRISGSTTSCPFIRVGNYGFSLAEFQEIVATTEPDGPTEGPVGLLLTLSDKPRRARAQWEALASQDLSLLARDPLVVNATPMALVTLLATPGDDRLERTREEYQRRLEEVTALRAGLGLPAHSVTNLAATRERAATLTIPGTLDLLNGAEVSLALDSQGRLVRKETREESDATHFLLTAGDPGQVLDTLDAADVTVTWLLGYPAHKPEEAQRAVDILIEQQIALMGKIARLDLEIAALTAALHVIDDWQGELAALPAGGGVILQKPIAMEKGLRF